MRAAILGLVLAAGLAASPALAIEPAAQVLAGTEAQTGLLPVHVDRREGQIYLSLPRPDAGGVAGRYIYLSALETGLGSAPIGLDRNASNGARILVFRRVGNHVLAEIENHRFRATTGTPAEQAAVRESFAYSTIWMGEVAAETAGGGFLVDIASFLTRDDMGIADAIDSGDGDYKLKPELSVADTNFVRVFPRNIELRGRLTFVADEPEAETGNILPVSGNASFLVRHSLVALPEAGYQPRRFDPRAGSFGSTVVDYSAPLGQPVVYELANRFRLERTDPSTERSPVVNPIVFHIDPGAPEPIRTALHEGVSWWSEAFDAAGFVDAFRVEILPEGADPLDIRYNVVNWVNRATRGWSYGQAIDDPRTGEIIRGGVLLGSLRVRQDLMIFEALVGAGLTGTGDPDDPITAALARIRQLGAHEVGHAIGLAHNFAGSAQGRFSVMDYPAPRIRLDEEGNIDLSDAYGVGLGNWDRFAIRWLYGARSEAEADRMMAAGLAAGLRFVGDGEARSAGSAHPAGSLWDDYSDPVAELARMMEVRRVAVSRFGPAAIGNGQPVSQLRRAFVPIWLLHRYQVEAAAKVLGGVDFAYSRNGDGQERAEPVPPEAQRAALSALLDTLSPDALRVPANVLPYLSSAYSGNTDRQTSIEIFPTAGGPVFDPLTATELGAVVTLTDLLAPERLNRLEIQHEANPDSPSAHEAIDALIDRVFGFDGRARDAGVRRRIATTTALALARVQRDAGLSPTVALALSDGLEQLAENLTGRGSDVQAQWGRGLARLLQDREALDAAIADEARLPRVPPGMPIG
ncbi:zinc-dependent metalloprotease [Parasphingopyxis marina]|uniref:Zinc-dependent metalloprotease n=1 Tax=Parasphingopyxis marina TaxID=2761622 RepID=A0A842HWW2_9SPHN|nr:zinc-dependent metalloprotease [Parasphingopyxis marina]MBC2777452.1 zinc-dependent metalloprotease [Parasphingopyxis marina]